MQASFRSLHRKRASWARLRLFAVVLVVGGMLGGSSVRRAGAQTSDRVQPSRSLIDSTRVQGSHLAVHPKSRFWIQGKASSINFTCRVGRVDGRAEIPPARTTRAVSQTNRRPEVVVRVPVMAFDCGNSRMTKDLQEALRMASYPEIRFELVHATVEKGSDRPDEWYTVHALGALTIAGTKRLVQVQAEGRALDRHRFQMRGCKPIRMTYFNIEPPTRALGLIKVKNRVVVQFDLLAHAPSETSSSPFEVVSVEEAPPCPAS